MSPHFPKALLAATASLCLQGCLSTWMRLEDGTVLAPGHTEFALAYGKVPRVAHDCSDFTRRRRVGDHDLVCVEPPNYYPYDPETETFSLDTTAVETVTPSTLSRETESHFGLAWRLGALGPFGPFTGLEVGLQTEVPTAPISQEFRVALGLPGSDSIRAHSLIAGWGTGMWADDTWFLQYAASRTFGPCRVFGSLRGAIQATYIADLLDGDKLEHLRTWDVQLGTGARVKLGRAPVLPDWLLIGLTADLSHQGYPELGSSTEVQAEGFGVAWTSAMGWAW